MIKVSVLCDNMAGGRGFLAEHGLSLLLQAGEQRILFDTGQSSVFMQNADCLGEELLNLTGIVLSHGHFDHCGGMKDLVRLYRDHEKCLPPVYVRENAFRPKTAVNGNRITFRDIGIPWSRRLIQDAVHVTGNKEMIGDGIWVLGDIPYTVDFEKKPDTFFIVKGDKKLPDYMEDEQLLVFETEKGLCVFGGCCHPGIVNCLAYVKQSFPEKPVYSVLAGMHLMNHSRERILETAEALKGMNIQILMPVHCTGLEAIGKLKDIFGDKCSLLETGKVFEVK